MIRKIPVIGHTISSQDLFSGLAGIFDKDIKNKFSKNLLSLMNSKYIFLLNSGISSFYIILEALKKISARSEVILPAYTAPSLVVAVIKAGLKPVLCDITLGDFNIDTQEMYARINQNTLCVVGVHMFGIPWEKIKDLKSRLGEGVFVIEDCAQAFGSRIESVPVGVFSDAGFFSFGRGKNFPTNRGGCIVTNDEVLYKKIGLQMLAVKRPGIISQFLSIMELVALSAAFRPVCYGLLYPFISRFKDSAVPPDFKAQSYVSFQAGVGNSLIKKIDVPFEKRLKNGMELLRALKGIDDIILPEISDGITPIFNRFPVVFKDKDMLDEVIKNLSCIGIDSSKLYLKALHHIFDLGYGKDEFPNSVYFADRLLTLPVHSYVEPGDIESMVTVVRDTIKRKK